MLLTLCGTAPVSAQTPDWIWDSPAAPQAEGRRVLFFRKTFRTPPLLWNARLTAAADDSADVFLNGVLVAKCERWDRPVRAEVTVRLNQGENVLAVAARNEAGPGGLLVHLNLGGETTVVSDDSWLVSETEEPGWSSLEFNAAPWKRARSLGAHGIQPWGDVLLAASATGPGSLTVLPGFKVELLRSAAAGEGSWVCLAFDERGRLTISPEGDDVPLLRFSFRDGQVAGVSAIPAPARFAMGLLYAKGSLFANARGPDGAGLYKLTDADGNDQFDPGEMALLKKFEGGGEHGYHALRLGPDGMIYVLNGNGTKVPGGISEHSRYRNYAQDVLSLNPDETTEAGAAAAVQCHVLRTDTEGKEWELWAGGMRNAYAFDFSTDGELFTFDSDMEWDWGAPWYRPTRILHLVPGGEYGWRDGTRTWPDFYEDSLPSVADIGIGSPTGMRFGTKSRFPGEYQRALFAMDWSYGRILAVHLEPAGGSYRARWETFLSGAPLNLTDLEFGPDGAMYFITGGRGTQSGLYRVSYIGAEAPKAPPGFEAGDEARAIRRRLECLGSGEDAINSLWPWLGDSDRSLRFASRVALERQEIALWKDRAVRETNASAGLTALLALARVGGSDNQEALLESLGRKPLDSLPESQVLTALRVLQVSMLRQGRFQPAVAREWIGRLDGRYPASSWPLNRELSRLLIYLEAPGVVKKTLDLLDAAAAQEEQLHYVAQLRHLRTGWTLADRRRYFEWWLKPRQNLKRPPDLVKWFADVGRSYVDGAWVDRYLREFRADAVAALSPFDRAELAGLLDAPFQQAQLLPSRAREFVREWTMADLAGEIDRPRGGRDLARGRQAFVDAQCIRCHRFGNDGGPIGPELTGAASKYDGRSLLESILEPSKVLSEQYQNVTVWTKDGDSFTGRIIRENEESLFVETDPLSGARESVARAEVESIAPSALSPMPEGSVNVLSREEILDLVAYLQSGGADGNP